jgi:hypothetical protein
MLFFAARARNGEDLFDSRLKAQPARVLHGDIALRLSFSPPTGTHVPQPAQDHGLPCRRGRSIPSVGRCGSGECARHVQRAGGILDRRPVDFDGRWGEAVRRSRWKGRVRQMAPLTASANLTVRPGAES